MLLLFLVVVPIVEIYVAILVGHVIGAWNTIGLLLLFSIAGLWLTKRAGLGVLGRIRAQLDAGRMPGNELIDGALVVIGGLLLAVPGFVTDAVGLLLVLPPSRASVRGTVKRRFRRRVTFLGGGRYDGRLDGPDDIIDV